MIGVVTRLLAWRVLKQVLVILLLVETVFLAESLTGLFETIFRYDGGSLQLAAVLFLTAPEIIDFALPLAIVVGLYTAILSARENNELVVLSAAGVSSRRIILLVVATGFCGLAASLFVAGYVTPLAAKASRLMIWGLQERQVIRRINGDAGDDLQQVEGRTFIFSSTSEPGKNRGRLFLHHSQSDTGWRVTTADDWAIQRQLGDRRYLVMLNDVVDYNIEDFGYRYLPLVTTRVDAPAKLTVTRAAEVRVPLEIDQLVGRPTDSERREELTLSAAIADLQANDSGGGAGSRRVGELISRALLCPIAALLALAAVASARGGFLRLAAMPAAATATLGIDALARMVLVPLAQEGGPGLFAGGVIFALCAVPLFLFLSRHAQRIVAPAFGRT